MDYRAVDKVGVLAFADYIHDRYVGSSCPKAELWYELMGGTTLVDLMYRQVLKKRYSTRLRWLII